jgi:hypothetical protein
MSPKNPAAVALGRKGGKATAESRTAEQRSESARKAVEARWAKQREELKQLNKGAKDLLAKSRKRQAQLSEKAKGQ